MSDEYLKGILDRRQEIQERAYKDVEKAFAKAKAEAGMTALERMAEAAFVQWNRRWLEAHGPEAKVKAWDEVWPGDKKDAMDDMRAAIQSLIDDMPEDAVNAIGRHDADRRAIITAALRKVIEG